jgi:hypothetical protein
MTGAGDRLRRLAETARGRRAGRDERSERVVSPADLRRLRKQRTGPGFYERYERRMRVVLLAPADHPDTRRWADFYAGRGIEVYGISLAGQRDPGPARPRVRTAYLPSPRAIVRLRALIDQARPDVVHAHATGRYALLGAVADRHPLVISIPAPEPDRPPDGPAARRAAEFVRRRADAVVPVDAAANADDPDVWDRVGTRMLDVFARLGLHGK